MIISVRFCYDHSLKIKGGREMTFQPGFNVLAGPNGSGKSTVLQALHSCVDCDIESDGQGETRLFDVETMNPHAPGAEVGDMRDMILRTRGVFSSHGQIMKAALGSFPLRVGDVFLVDEPESGQDAVGMDRMREVFKSICDHGCQVIAASHHPFMWKGAHVIELKTGYLEVTRQQYRQQVHPTDED